MLTFQVAEQLKKVCNLIYPSNPDAQLRCSTMVEEYYPSIIELIVNSYLQPESVCISLGQCP